MFALRFFVGERVDLDLKRDGLGMRSGMTSKSVMLGECACRSTLERDVGRCGGGVVEDASERGHSALGRFLFWLCEEVTEFEVDLEVTVTGTVSKAGAFFGCLAEDV